MNIYWLAFIGVAVLSATVGFAYLVMLMHRQVDHGKQKDDLIDQAEDDVEKIFNDEFREELKNRGRLHFERIINENAMFLQQDLQLTASQLNEYMQDSIKKVLKEEFSKYEESIENAKSLAIESIEKTQQVLEEQREMMGTQLQEEVKKEQSRLVEKFEANMSQVVNYYLIDAIGNEIDLSDQLEFIFRQLEDNKDALIDDIKNGM